MSRRESNHHGVIVVDKPTGMTSHDVVQRVRRIAKTSRVGHAGTLDPLATGVLVVMVGEGTKLGPYLTSENKRYEARVAFGRGTDTLDSEGAVIEEAPLPRWWSSIEPEPFVRAIAHERARTEQVPPVYSAIKIGGQSSHALARRGEAPELAPRPVRVESLDAHDASPDGSVTLALEVSKGYYVRSLARDLGIAIGCPAHLTALRRTASGRFTLANASRLDALEAEPPLLAARLVSVPEAAALAMPLGQLTEEGVLRARQGKALGSGDFRVPPPEQGASGWLDPVGNLVAVGHKNDDNFRILRGFC